MKNSVNSICILGKSLSAYLVAACIKNAHKNIPIEITIIEYGGEDFFGNGAYPCLPQFRAFNYMLGIKEKDLIDNCAGIPYLGQRLMREDKDLIIGLAETGFSIEGISFAQILRAAEAQYNEYDKYNFASQMLVNNKFMPPKNINQFLSSYNFGFNIDLSKYKNLLRNICTLNDVKFLEAIATPDIKLNDFGDIESINNISSDIYIDASANDRLLANKLKIKFENSVLKNNTSLWAASDPMGYNFTAEANLNKNYYLKSVLTQSGHWHEYCFDSSEIDIPIAKKSFQKVFGIENQFIMTTKQGHLENYFQNNMIAIGTAAISIENLFSANLLILQNQIVKLLKYFPHKQDNSIIEKQYNQEMGRVFESAENYSIAARIGYDIEDINSEEINDNLKRKIKQFRSRGKLIMYEDEIYTKDDWPLLLMGLGNYPNKTDPRLDSYTKEDLNLMLANYKSSMHQTMGQIPPMFK